MAIDVQLRDASHKTGSALSLGTTFPLFDIVRVGISMLLLTAATLKGHELATWTVVLHRHDCRKCDALIDEFSWIKRTR